MIRKTFKNVLFLLGLFVPMIINAEEPVAVLKRYGLESAVIEYMIKGVNDGVETVYFDQWGLREARISKIRYPVVGIKNILTIKNMDKTYNIDINTRLGNIEEVALHQKSMAKHPEKNPELTEIQALKAQGARKTGQETLSGKKCDVWYNKQTKTKTWIWNGLPLQIHTQDEKGETMTRAIKVQVGGEIPEEIFTVPAGINFIQEDINTIFIF